jgi:hypothetical protein
MLRGYSNTREQELLYSILHFRTEPGFQMIIAIAIETDPEKRGSIFI